MWFCPRRIGTFLIASVAIKHYVNSEIDGHKKTEASKQKKNLKYNALAKLLVIIVTVWENNFFRLMIRKAHIMKKRNEEKTLKKERELILCSRILVFPNYNNFSINLLT